MALLEKRDYSGMFVIAKKERNIFRVLISLTYEKEKLICWRAIEAIGLVVSELTKEDPSSARNFVQRLLWMMRDESGNNVGSAPEILGEIVRNSPDAFSDIAPIITSFHDEDMLRRGVLRALVRISEIRPDLLKTVSFSFLHDYIEDVDAVIRIYSAMLAGYMGLKEYISDLERLSTADTSSEKIFRDGDFVEIRGGKIAEETVIMLRGKN